MAILSRPDGYKESEVSMNIQWYPGHMTKAKRAMQEDVKLVDLVIELIDARIPLATRNPEIDKLAVNKSRLVLLNKADLANQMVTKKWIEYFAKQDILALAIDSRTNHHMKPIHDAILQVCAEKIERDKRRGIMNRPIRAMVVGIPNVGKSTFINSFVKKASAKTGNRPGVTKGNQWIKVNKQVELLDTPGILWPKFEDQQVGLLLAFVGSINDQIIQLEELVIEFIKYTRKYQISAVEDYYQCEKGQTEAEVLKEIAKIRGCLKKGGEVDYLKASQMILDDLRKARIGRITLQVPPEEKDNDGEEI